MDGEGCLVFPLSGAAGADQTRCLNELSVPLPFWEIVII